MSTDYLAHRYGEIIFISSAATHLYYALADDGYGTALILLNTVALERMGYGREFGTISIMMGAAATVMPGVSVGKFVSEGLDLLGVSSYLLKIPAALIAGSYTSQKCFIQWLDYVFEQIPLPL